MIFSISLLTICHREPSDTLASNCELFAANTVELPDVCILITLMLLFCYFCSKHFFVLM
jgi:hypothetical protein